MFLQIFLQEYLSRLVFLSYYNRTLVRLSSYQLEDNGIYSRDSNDHWYSSVCWMLSATPSHFEDSLLLGEQFPSPKPGCIQLICVLVFKKSNVFLQLKQRIILDIQFCSLNDNSTSTFETHTKSPTINHDHKRIQKDVILIFEITSRMF